MILGIAWGMLFLLLAMAGSGSVLGAATAPLFHVALLLIVGGMLLRPDPGTEEPDELYELHGVLAITFVTALGLLLFGAVLLPGLFPSDGGDFPLKPGTLLLLGATIKSLGLLQRATQTADRSTGAARWLLSGVVSAALLGSLSLSWQEWLIPALTGFTMIVLGPTLFFRAVRSDWIVRLRRPEKYRLAGLALLMVLSSIGWYIVVNQLLVADDGPVLALDHAAEVLGEVVAMITFAWGSGLLVRTLATLPTARAMDRRQHEVASLSTLGMMMLDEFDRDRLIAGAIDTAAEVTGSVFVWLCLYDDPDSDDDERIVGERHQISPTMVDHVHRLALPEGAGTIGEVGRTADAISLFRATLPGDPGDPPELVEEIYQGMIAVVPITGAEARRGALYLFTLERRGYDRDDRLMLETVAAQISLTVKHADLMQRSIERERLENEMHIAREAQSRLLPTRLPELPWCELHALSLPASMVGGDYYDTIEFRDGTIGCIVADVSGKGAGAALYMGVVKGVARGLSRNVDGPLDFLIRMNTALYRNIDPRFFVTMSIVRIVPERGTVEIARAGHTPALLVRSADRSSAERADTVAAPTSPRIESIVPGGIGLALTDEKRFAPAIRVESVRLGPGDLLALYSDGLSEARSATGEELGDRRLGRLLEESAIEGEDRPLVSIAEEIVRKISAFSAGARQHDDITLLLVRCCGDATGRRPTVATAGSATTARPAVEQVDPVDRESTMQGEP